MKTIEEIIPIVADWAVSLPFAVNVHLFGSVVKGKPNPSDIDLALEFLETSYNYLNEQRLHKSLWYELHQEWEYYLSDKLDMKVGLRLYDSDTRHIHEYLEETSLLIFTTKKTEDE